jgi:ABC-type Fe3+/spermidine/putrescine transport system ATPase subunit
MLDEPLGSLDRAWRERLMIELRDILKRVGVTALYVTHDQTEAFAIADRVVIMNSGRIEQTGSPEMIYHHPATPFVAHFLGLTNLAAGQVIDQGRITSAWGDLTVNTGEYQPGDQVQVLIRPEAASLNHDASSGQDTLRGYLVARSFRGGRYRIRIEPDSGPTLTFELSAASRMAVGPGDPVTITLDPAGVVLLPQE